MKRLFNHIVFILTISIFALSNTASGHSVQVGYCVNCAGELRIYVEHWHGALVGATTMDIELTVGGTTTTVTGEPKGFISDTVISDLPECATPLTVFGSCEPTFIQCGANTCNYWVVYDFPTVQKGVPIDIRILSGNNQFTEDGCAMFPASPPEFTIPLDVTPDVTPSQTVCSGNSANVDLTNYSGAIQWQSSATSGGPFTDIAGETAATLSTGALTTTTFYQAVVVGDCGTGTSNETAVVVSQGPPVNAGADITTCPSATPGNLGAPPATGATYSWSPATGLNSATVANPTVDISAVMDITYTVTATSPGCTPVTDEVRVTVSNDLTVTVNSPALCFGESATLIASGADTYSWSPITALSATTGATVISTSAIDIAYTVTGTSNGCVGVAVATLVVEAIPSSDAGADISICSGTTGTIGASSTSGYIYDWLPTTDLNDPTLANPTVTPTNYTGGPINLSYIVTTSPAGCFSTDTVIVTVDPATDPTFTYTGSTFCQGGGGTDPSPTIAVAGGAFTSSPAGLSIDANSGLINVAASTIASYTVTYSHAGPCPSSSTANVTITNIPDAQFSFDVYCQDEANPLPTFPAGSSAGLFTSTGGLVFADASTGEVDLAGSTAGPYTITNTIAAGGGCPNATSTNTITINAIPVTTVDNATICDGETAILTASGATTYVWIDATTLGTLSVSPTTTTPYTVTGTTAGCSSTAAGQVTVNSLPVVTVNDASVCGGVPATLSASGASTYSWSNSATGPSIVESPAATTTYTVTGTTLGCTATAVGTVSLISAPIVTVNSEPICDGTSATLIASGATTYAWSDGSTGNTIIVSPIVATSYTVTGSASGCDADAISTVTVNPVPTSPFTVTPACIDLPSTITYTGNAPGTATYNWNFGGGTIITGTGQGPYTVSWATSGTPSITLDVALGTCASPVTTEPVTISPLPTITVAPTAICEGDMATLAALGGVTYVWSDGSTVNPFTDSPLVTSTYSVTGTDINSCTGTATATVTVNPLPVITVSESTVCEGFNATITASGSISYVWSNNNLTPTISVSPLITTAYTVVGTDALNCFSTASGTVTVYPKPVALFSSDPDPVGVFNPTVSFIDQSSGDVTNWFWDYGDGDSIGATDKNPIHAYPQDTASYTATLIVHNGGFCYDTVTRIITVGPEFSFFVPNAFTPDGNGINDEFLGKGEGIIEFEMMIFDRWGNFIFYTDDITEGWDGKVSEGILNGVDFTQQDVFIWKVNITDLNDKTKQFIGTVTVLRGE